jgi:hypothetical protein
VLSSARRFRQRRTPDQAAWQSAVQADRDEHAKTKMFVSRLRQALQLAFAGSIDTLADPALVRNAG